jgi:hypothetical protein
MRGVVLASRHSVGEHNRPVCRSPGASYLKGTVTGPGTGR